MKRCPQCNRVETDDTLGFCRADGTALIGDSGPVSTEGGTVKFTSSPVSSEIETSVLPHTSTSPKINRLTAPTTVLPASALAALGEKDKALFGWKKTLPNARRVLLNIQ